MQVCPVRAISRDYTTGAMVVDHDKCLVCKLCTIAAPELLHDYVGDAVLKCDLCGGIRLLSCVHRCYQPPGCRTGQPGTAQAYAERFKDVYEVG